jgi:hypothetical protein
MKNTPPSETCANAAMWLGVACILCTLPSACYSQNPAPTPVQPTTAPVQSINLIDYIKMSLNKMTPAERQQTLIYEAKKGWYITVPDFWKIDDPDTILGGVESGNEPYAAIQIDALARVQSHFTDDYHRRVAAAILYRYGRPEGLAYFEGLFKANQDGGAARFLLTTGDRKYWPDILRAFRRDPTKWGGLAPDLARWQSLAVASALLAGFRNDPDDLLYAEGLAAERCQAARPLIEHQYATISPNNSDEGIAAIALIILGDNRPELMSYLASKLNPGPDEVPLKQGDDPKVVQEDEVIQGFADFGLTSARSLLVGVINRYLTMSIAAAQTSRVDFSKMPGDDKIAADAGVALAKLGGTAEVIALLKRFKANGADPGTVDDVAFALYNNTADKSVTASLGSVMGDKWMMRAKELKELKTIPSDLQPPSTHYGASIMDEPK